MMMAQVTRLEPGEFVHTFGDAHLYLNHLEQADLQLARPPRALPRMQINPAVRSIFDFKFEDFALIGLRPAPAHQGRGGGVTGSRAHRLRGGRGRERRHRPQRRAAVAAAVRPQALPQAHPGQAHDHGAQDLRLRSASRSMAATTSSSRGTHDFSAPGVHVASVDRGGHCARPRALAAKRGVDEVAVIGGAEIFRADASAGQPHLPDAGAWRSPPATPVSSFRTPRIWSETAREPMAQGPGDQYPADFVVLERQV